MSHSTKHTFSPLRGYLRKGPQAQLTVQGNKFSGWPIYASRPDNESTEVVILTASDYRELLDAQQEND